ncbi:MAG: hypothetical protein KDC53_20735, partial [Saprospiraceae bacterium]|nr:hypothetical protein [Saprospiraceae bacterium]
VLDEPFYGVYLEKTEFDHPGKNEIKKSLPLEEDAVLNQIFANASGSSHMFIKNMASHFLVLDAKKFATFQNVFLIRDPLRIITSYSKVIKTPTAQDIGIERQAKLFKWYTKNSTTSPLVIDSNDILSNPEVHLRSLCIALGIDFQQNMLSWPAGEKDYDGIWAPYWYKHVHRSTHFEKQPSSEDPLPSYLEPLYKESRDHYRFLYKHSITNPENAAKIQSKK